MLLDSRRIEVVDDEMAAVLRAKTGSERLAIADGMYHFARVSLLNVLKGEHPDWSEQKIQAEAAHRLSHGAI